MSDNRANVYEENGRIIYRASALGGCLVALAAARQNYDPQPYPAKVLEIFEAGNQAEEWYNTVHRTLTRQQEEVELPISSKLAIRGHIDGIQPNGRTGAVVEIKSMNPADWNNWTPDWIDSSPLWMKYSWQVSVYMHVLKMPATFIMINRATYAIKTHTVEVSPRSLDEIRARVFEAEATAREDELVCALGDFFCPYKTLHSGPELVEDVVLETKLAEYIKRQAVIKQDQAGLAVLRQEIEKYLDGRTKVHLLSGHSVSVSEFDVKEKVIPAGRQKRMTVRGPK